MLLEQVKTSEEGLYKARKANISLKTEKVKKGAGLCLEHRSQAWLHHTLMTLYLTFCLSLLNLISTL